MSYESEGDSPKISDTHSFPGGGIEAANHSGPVGSSLHDFPVCCGTERKVKSVCAAAESTAPWVSAFQTSPARAGSLKGFVDKYLHAENSNDGTEGGDITPMSRMPLLPASKHEVRATAGGKADNEEMLAEKWEHSPSFGVYIRVEMGNSEQRAPLLKHSDPPNSREGESATNLGGIASKSCPQREKRAPPLECWATTGGGYPLSPSSSSTNSKCKPEVPALQQEVHHLMQQHNPEGGPPAYQARNLPSTRSRRGKHFDAALVTWQMHQYRTNLLGTAHRGFKLAVLSAPARWTLRWWAQWWRDQFPNRQLHGRLSSSCIEAQPSSTQPSPAQPNSAQRSAARLRTRIIYVRTSEVTVSRLTLSSGLEDPRGMDVSRAAIDGRIPGEPTSASHFELSCRGNLHGKFDRW